MFQICELVSRSCEDFLMHLVFNGLTVYTLDEVIFIFLKLSC